MHAAATNLSEGAQSRENTASDPGGVLPLGRREDLDPHVLDGHLPDLVEEPVAEALGQRSAAGQDDVGIQCRPEVQVCPADGVDNHLVHPGVFQTDNLGVEENLGRSEALLPNLEPLC